MADGPDLLGFGRTPAHDYGLAPPGPDGAGGRSTFSGVAVAALIALGGLLVGFLLSTGFTAGRQQALAQFERKDELVALILQRQEHADELGAELAELRGRLDAAHAQAAEGVPALQAEVDGFEMAAGLAGVRGPGVRLTLRDAESTCPAEPYACRIQDRDLQLAVNALFDAGAEAVAVGGERIVATTAIRSAGQTILINLRVLTGPYEIEAIGDPDALRDGFDRTEFAQDFAAWTRDYGLGLDISQEDELAIPGFTGTVGMTAVPADGGTAVEQ